MAVRVQYRRMSPVDAKDHEHIERLKGTDESDNSVVDKPRQWWYENVRDKKISAYVKDAAGNKADRRPPRKVRPETATCRRFATKC